MADTFAYVFRTTMEGNYVPLLALTLKAKKEKWSPAISRVVQDAISLRIAQLSDPNTQASEYKLLGLIEAIDTCILAIDDSNPELTERSNGFREVVQKFVDLKKAA